MNMDIFTFMEAMYQELKAAEKKHPVFPTNIVKATAILSEESGEAVQEANRIDDDKNGSIEKWKTEVLQTAAMCFRILKNFDQITAEVNRAN